MLAEENKSSGRSPLDGEFSYVRIITSNYTWICDYYILYDRHKICCLIGLTAVCFNRISKHVKCSSGRVYPSLHCKSLCKLQVTIATIQMLDLTLDNIRPAVSLFIFLTFIHANCTDEILQIAFHTAYEQIGIKKGSQRTL